MKVCLIRFYLNIGIPHAYYYGLVGKYYALVMDLLGHSLEELFEICNNKFSVKTVCNIGIQAVFNFYMLFFLD